MTTATIDTARIAEETRTDQHAHMMCFSATESRCSQVTAQMLADLEEEFSGRITVEHVDVWADPQRAVEHGVLTIPTVIVAIEGEESFRVCGLYSRRQFLKKLGRRTGITL